MGYILIDRIRVSGFRGLNDFEMSLSKTTILTGMNNSGKTSILKALQFALGSRAFLEVDDLFTSKDETAQKIQIDIRIVQIDDSEKYQEEFDEEWEAIFKTDKIKVDGEFAYVPLRTTATYNSILSKFDIEQQILNTWDSAPGVKWQDIIGKKQSFSVEEMPFFYIDAKRDVIEDMKLKSSYLGKMLADVAKGYNKVDIETLESLIAELNEQAIDKSSILTTIKTALEGVNSAMDNQESCVELSPFSKKIRDLSRGISIHYGEDSNSFAMDYHGMGTRSWSSLLTLKAFITHSNGLAEIDTKSFFPIIAIEEPESHLHPNAQKKLYRQMAEMPGQKIISTHSTYIAAAAEISEVRGIYKSGSIVCSGNIDEKNLLPDDQRKLRQKVVNTRGEVFFSKAIVLFEGETEEQALPILAAKHFGCPPSELGIDFIGVGGAGQYYPFLLFAEAFNIPWYIFSDGEEAPVKDMTKAVKRIRGVEFEDIAKEHNVFVLENEEDFEKHILNQNYKLEIIKSLKSLNGDQYITDFIRAQNGTSKGRIKTSQECTTCHQYIYQDQIRNYIGAEGYRAALYDMMVSQKTKFGLEIANKIISSEKALPSKITTLFNKIKKDFSHE